MSRRLAGVKLATRCAYAPTLSIAVLLSGQRFEEVDKVLLRFFKGLRGRLKEVSYNLIHSKLKRFLSGCIQARFMAVSGVGKPEEPKVNLTLKPRRCIRCSLVLDEVQVKVERELAFDTVRKLLERPEVREKFLKFLESL